MLRVVLLPSWWRVPSAAGACCWIHCHRRIQSLLSPQRALALCGTAPTLFSTTVLVCAAAATFLNRLTSITPLDDETVLLLQLLQLLLQLHARELIDELKQ